MSQSVPDDNAAARTTFQHMVDLFVKPEVERRVQEGTLQKPLALRKFQVVLRDDGDPVVRLNDEVKAVAKIRITATRDIDKGDPIYEHDIDEIVSIRLTDQDDPDCAHVTCFVLSGQFNLAFDFRYNKALAAKHLDTAREFLASAEEALRESRMAVFVDNLLSATELTARAVLLTAPDKKFRKKASHKVVQERYRDYVELGNGDSEQTVVYMTLRRLRDAKRYVTADPTIDLNDARRYLETVQSMHEDALRHVS